jgi:MFS family permease
MFLMGFRPSASAASDLRQVGLLAPALLVLLRLIQGFAVAGEISGASSMILEHAPFGRRGYYSSFTLQGVQAGRSWPPRYSCRWRTTCPPRRSTAGAGASRSCSASS